MTVYSNWSIKYTQRVITDLLWLILYIKCKFKASEIEIFIVPVLYVFYILYYLINLILLFTTISQIWNQTHQPRRSTYNHKHIMFQQIKDITSRHCDIFSIFLASISLSSGEFCRSAALPLRETGLLLHAFFSASLASVVVQEQEQSSSFWHLHEQLWAAPGSVLFTQCTQVVRRIADNSGELLLLSVSFELSRRRARRFAPITTKFKGKRKC